MKREIELKSRIKGSMAAIREKIFPAESRLGG
jgi:hypothetical protein